MKLSKQEISLIEAKAEDILSEVYGGKTIEPPVDLEKIAEKYGISLKKVSFNEPDALGQLDRAQKTIYVSNGEYFPRMAFTIAHELGHYILHENKEKDTFWRLDIINIDKQDQNEETEANIFAASLLMPKSLVTLWWSKTRDASLMAKIFGVSQTAMQYRLKNLCIN